MPTKTHRNSPEQQKRYDLKYRYGLTLEEFHKMKEEQDDVCASCFSSGKRLVIDHNHETGKVRQLICYRCNYMVGLIEDGTLDNIKQYLERHARDE